MQGYIGRFTDREEPLAAFDRLLAVRDAPARALVYWGVSGQGKSSLLRHLHNGPATPKRCELIDLDPLLAVDTGGADPGRDLAAVLVDSMARVIAGWSGPARLARRRYERFRARLRPAAPVATSVNAHMSASEGSSLSRTSIHVDARPAAGAVDRDVLTDELCRLARGLRRRHCVLLLDTSERLRLLADAAVGQTEHGHPGHQGGVAQWFAGQLLPRLLAEAPRLKVVLAGREPVELPDALVAERIELTEWELEHTAEYLHSCGLDAQALSRPVHAVCRGVPVWTALVAELAAQDRGADEPVTPQWLAEVAAGRPADEWLPNRFMRRLPREQQRVVMAAAALRSISKEAVSTLLDDAELSPGWYETLCGYSFMRLVRDPGGRAERRIHDLVRLAILTHLDREEPTYRRTLHERAARYFAEQGSFLDEAYHRFAIGDDACVDGWRRLLGETERDSDTEAVLRLTEILTAPEQAPHTFRRFPHDAAAAALAGGRIALDQGRFADAESLLRQAREGFHTAEDEEGEAHALRWWGKTAQADGRVAEAASRYARSLEINRSLGRKRTVGHLLRDLAGLRDAADPQDAISMLEEALGLFREVDDHTCETGTLRHLAQLNHAHGGPLDRTEDLYRQALAGYRRIRSRNGEARAAKALAIALAEAPGRQAEAEVLFLDAVTAFRDAGDRDGEADARNRLGILIRDKGREEEAEAHYRAALELYRDMESVSGEAAVLHNLALLMRRTQREREGETFLERAAELNRSCGEAGNEARNRLALAEVARGRKDFGREERLLRQALELAVAHGEPGLQATILHDLGHAANRAHRRDEADALYRRDLDISEASGDPSGTARALRCLGHLALKSERFEDAERYFRRALDIHRERGESKEQASVLHLLGRVATRIRGREDEAAACYEQAVELLGGATDRRTEVHALRDLAVMTLRNGQDDDSARDESSWLFERSLRLALEVGDGDCGFIAWINLAALGVWRDGREAEATELLEQVVRLVEKKHGPSRARSQRFSGRLVMKWGSRDLSGVMGRVAYEQLRFGWSGGLRTRARMALGLLRSRSG